MSSYHKVVVYTYTGNLAAYRRWGFLDEGEIKILMRRGYYIVQYHRDHLRVYLWDGEQSDVVGHMHSMGYIVGFWK